jgi:hypothetical protein
MKYFKPLFMLIFTFLYVNLSAQKGNHAFGISILTDSTSTLFFVVNSPDDGLGGKVGNTSIANILVYNFVTEEQNLLFPMNSYDIQQFWTSHYTEAPRFMARSKTWIFIKAEEKNSPLASNCRPSILFICDNKGKQLKQLTTNAENCKEVIIYEKLGFALLKMQKDNNNNNCFNYKDDFYYYKRLNLSDLSFGKDIELPNR